MKNTNTLSKYIPLNRSLFQWVSQESEGTYFIDSCNQKQNKQGPEEADREIEVRDMERGGNRWYQYCDQNTVIQVVDQTVFANVSKHLVLTSQAIYRKRQGK